MNKSNRGHLLTWQGQIDCPIVCVEMYCKWYDVFVVFPDGRIEAIPADLFNDMRERDSDVVVIDHDFHPNFLQRIADHYGGQVCDLSKELAMGRWFLTYDNTGPEVVEP